MRVLIVHPCKGYYGGAEEVVERLSDYLIKRGHDLALITKDAPTHFSAYSYVMNTYSWMEFRHACSLMIDGEGPDVIVCFNFPAGLAVMGTKIPVVWYCNEPPEIFTNWKRKPFEWVHRLFVRRSVNRVIVATPKDQKRFQDIYKKSSVIIPYGVDYEYWSKDLGIQRSKELLVLQVGHPELFELGKRIFGGIALLDYKAKFVQLDGATREQVRETYNRATVLMHPITSHGGFLVPLEAICAGLPIVVYPEFAMAPFIEICSLGIVSSNFTSTILGQGYKEVDMNKAREWVKTNLTWEAFGRGVEEELIEIVEKEASKLV